MPKGKPWDGSAFTAHVAIELDDDFAALLKQRYRTKKAAVEAIERELEIPDDVSDHWSNDLRTWLREKIAAEQKELLVKLEGVPVEVLRKALAAVEKSEKETE